MTWSRQWRLTVLVGLLSTAALTWLLRGYFTGTSATASGKALRTPFAREYEHRRLALLDDWRPELVEESFGYRHLADESFEDYVARLRHFVSSTFASNPGPLGNYRRSLDESLDRLSEHVAPLNRAELPRRLATTTPSQDASLSKLPHLFTIWPQMHHPEDGWSLHIYNDDEMDTWLKQTLLLGMGGTFEAPHAGELYDVFQRFDNGALKTDTFRYLLMALGGGIYADSDTAPIRPFDQWGVGYEDVTPASLANPALDASGPSPILDPTISMVISIESDGDMEGFGDGYRSMHGLARRLQICQWTLMAKPYHPIFIDAVGSIVDGERNSRAIRRSRTNWEPELDRTGPGVFSDAVMRYLVMQFGVTPQALQGLTKPVRIGDIVILPRYSFAQRKPQSIEQDPYGAVHHGFAGSWRGTRPVTAST